MNQEYFAGYHLGKVFEDEEAKRLKELEEAERKKKRQELEGKVNARKRGKPEAEERNGNLGSQGKRTSSVIVPVTYQGIEFEPTAFYDSDGKKLYTFQQSLDRLKKAGYDRHALPCESFSLISDGLEGNLSGIEKAVQEDMLKSYGEWLSLAFERQGDILLCYTHPCGLGYKENKGYFKTRKFSFDDKKEFDIAGIPSEEWVGLERLDDALVKFLYSRSFKDLPKKIREGTTRAQVYLPPENVVWPVGRGYFGSRFCIDCYVCNGRASRGVRAQKNIGGSQ